MAERTQLLRDQAIACASRLGPQRRADHFDAVGSTLHARHR
jgi:hypothetical protein